MLTTLVEELTDLHIRLLSREDETGYHDIVMKASVNLEEFRKKSGNHAAGDVETSLNALYGLLLLRLKKQTISRETEHAMATFSRLLAMLSQIFLAVERGEMEI